MATVPVSGGMGMHLLQKMGWRPGEGLGKERNGVLQPLLLEVKLDKKGLVANEEVCSERYPIPNLFVHYPSFFVYPHNRIRTLRDNIVQCPISEQQTLPKLNNR